MDARVVRGATTLSPQVRWRGRFASWGIESAPIVIVAFLAIISIGHIVQTDWASTFFYHGDSLSLPLIEQSIQKGQAFHWVFTSQNFLFPEAPIFALSTLFTDSARVAMLINACLNVVLLYALLRVIGHLLAHRSRHRFVEISIALGATLLYVVFVLLEQTAAVNGAGIASLFLFSTYYYGVIIVGLATIALTLWVTRAFGPAEWGRNRAAIFCVVVVALAALTTFSDPLFVFQVAAPLVACELLLLFCNRLSWRGLWVLVSPIAVGVAIGMGLRAAFPGLFASDVSQYLSLSNIPDSTRLHITTMKQLLSSGQGSLKILLLGFVLVVNFGILIYALYAQSRPRLARNVTTSELFIVAFVSASSISLIVGQVLTGSTTTRYLEPLFVFPLLTVVSVGVYVLRRLLVEVKQAELRRNLSRFLLTVAAAASALFVIVGIFNLAPLARAASGVGYTADQCLEKFVGNSKLNGVGSFWSVRPLEVYGTQKGVLLQIQDPLQVYAWMVNLAAYEDKTFSYLVVDSSEQVTATSLDLLGTPNKVVSCPGYQIYDYQNTPGEKILTDKVAASLAALLDK